MHNKVLLFDIWDTFLFKNGDSYDKQISDSLGIPHIIVREIIKSNPNVYNSETFFDELKKINNSVRYDQIKEIETNCINNSYYYNQDKDFFNVLLENNFKIYTISNSSYLTKIILEKFDLVFNKNFYSYEYGLLKPDVNFLKTVISELELEYNNIIVVGNDYKKDILPATSLGIKAILLKTEGKKEKKCLSVSKLEEILLFL